LYKFTFNIIFGPFLEHFLGEFLQLLRTAAVSLLLLLLLQ